MLIVSRCFWLSLHFCCSNRVRHAATNALLNSLEFTKANFEVDVSIRLLIDTMHNQFHLHPTDVSENSFLTRTDLSHPGMLYSCHIIHVSHTMCELVVEWTAFHHASGMWSNTVIGHSSSCGCPAVSWQDYVTVLSVHGTLYGTSIVCSKSSFYLFNWLMLVCSIIFMYGFHFTALLNI